MLLRFVVSFVNLFKFTQKYFIFSFFHFIDLIIRANILRPALFLFSIYQKRPEGFCSKLLKSKSLEMHLQDVDKSRVAGYLPG